MLAASGLMGQAVIHANCQLVANYITNNAADDNAKTSVTSDGEGATLTVAVPVHPVSPAMLEMMNHSRQRQGKPLLPPGTLVGGTKTAYTFKGVSKTSNVCYVSSRFTPSALKHLDSFAPERIAEIDRSNIDELKTKFNH